MPSPELIAQVAVVVLTGTVALGAGRLLLRRGHPVLAAVVTVVTAAAALPVAVFSVLLISFQVFGVDLID